ncbi:hypothetical protein JTE90_024684 [Oedothorax gibbosus]|uniref:Uncharacterized protein n=1 Tax=Oedothorax gibbosus TaxID=931172 RepID=A0AAV6TSY8_9ARAC|nr:hypothetical protein JTE90_024684 [Oedothorax gibbosus]
MWRILQRGFKPNVRRLQLCCLPNPINFNYVGNILQHYMRSKEKLPRVKVTWGDNLVTGGMCSTTPCFKQKHFKTAKVFKTAKEDLRKEMMVRG